MTPEHITHNSAITALEMAVELLEACLGKKSYRLTEREYLLMRRDLPYHLTYMYKPNLYLLVNRWYKPLGNPNYSPMVKYEDYPALMITINNVKENFLFNDGNAPWLNKKSAEMYLIKLKALLQHAEEV